MRKRVVPQRKGNMQLPRDVLPDIAHLIANIVDRDVALMGHVPIGDPGPRF